MCQWSAKKAPRLGEEPRTSFPLNARSSPGGHQGVSAFHLHRHGGAVVAFCGPDLKNAVPIAGLGLVAIEAVGETEAAAPGAAAEFAQQRCFGFVAVVRRSFGAYHQVAIGGLDVDRVAVHTRQFQLHGVAGFGFADFSVGNAFGGGQLLLETLEQLEGGLAKGQHDGGSEE